MDTAKTLPHSNDKDMTAEDDFALLAAATARRYHSAGRFARGFVTGKLRHDPVYRHLMATLAAWCPAAGNVLDIGCGRGILLNLLADALGAAFMNGCGPVLAGIDLRPEEVRRARQTLADRARIDQADVRQLEIPRCEVIIMLDVLLYLSRIEQDRVLENIVAHLPAGGIFILREADADAGWRFRVTQLAERLCALGRGHWRQPYHYRSARAWRLQLETLGFAVETIAMSQGTPFSNILFTARKIRDCPVIRNPHHGS
ncbi:MAG: class I SAM-dependent methyltransferase [Methylococcaceae bacterium]|jgi:SAM-dependent methyltransferase